MRFTDLPKLYVNSDNQEFKSAQGTVDVASLLRRQVGFKMLMGISTIFKKELRIATEILQRLQFTNFTVALVLNNM